MSRFAVTLFLSASCVVFASGCATWQRDLGIRQDPKYVELTETQPGDVPVPNGFEMVTRTKESYCLDLGPNGFRDAHLVYHGDMTPRLVARFYESTMVLPTYGWKDRSAYQTEGDRTLKFTKGQSICTVVITDLDNAEDARTRITVDIKSKA
jgi:hypothetical protein